MYVSSYCIINAPAVYYPSTLHKLIINLVNLEFAVRAISSFGRALPWHGRGDRFESGMVHNSQLAPSYHLILRLLTLT